ncbi:TetR/AcrR family transcriptional regulator [Gracilibacillus alcaliphilus]|uniref:TetR/AcrR family transcriptional regulator n=1 Tax=Gracilibacillus alcaliphilus TaxID=1401441 RepID=UPI0019568D5E|nr:TetR/AcrR family transcriptional regulator [Gracilibacillus alcaliphilus]MBM7679801.1 AcrR family transcriptional regulator [Gracilibacillus alcaliphilus]
MVHDDKRMKKGEQTRVNILHTAIAMIAENGLTEISTAKLAAASGVSKSTIFHHFKSNDELLINTLHVVFEELLQSIKIGEYRDVAHFFDTLGQTMIPVSDDELPFFKAFLSFFHEGIFNPAYREILVTYSEQMNDLFRIQLTQLVPKTVNQETIDSVSRLLLPMVDGIGFHFLLNRDSEKYQQVWNLQTKGILKLLDLS